MSEQPPRTNYGAFDNFMRWLGRMLAHFLRWFWALKWKIKGTAMGALAVVLLIAIGSAGGGDNKTPSKADVRAAESPTPTPKLPTPLRPRLRRSQRPRPDRPIFRRPPAHRPPEQRQQRRAPPQRTPLRKRSPPHLRRPPFHQPQRQQLAMTTPGTHRLHRMRRTTIAISTRAGKRSPPRTYLPTLQKPRWSQCEVHRATK